MVFALLISAIIWNVGTWYFGLPASSSHTLIGSIMGVGLANSAMAKGHVFGEGLNWAKASEVGISLLVSPVIGFVCAALLLLLSKALIKREDLYRAPDKDQPPPPWIRGLLMLTCTGVSYAHGSNDGQKGMGLIMLILIGILPATYAVNLDTTEVSVQEIAQSAVAIRSQMGRHAPGVALAGLQGQRSEVHGQSHVDRCPGRNGLRTGHVELAADLYGMRALGRVHQDGAAVGVLEVELPVVGLLRFMPSDVDLHGDGRRHGIGAGE